MYAGAIIGVRMFGRVSRVIQLGSLDGNRIVRTRSEICGKMGSGPWRGAARLTLFCSLVAMMALLLNAVVDRGLRRITTSTFGVFNQIVGGKINADILISGSSRALAHYDPRVIEARTGLSTFNIGLNGSQTDMQLARLKTYLQHNRKPRLVIYNLDVFSLQITHDGVYDSGQYIPYLREPEIYSALVGINPEIWKARLIPLYGYAVEDPRLNWLRGLAAFLGWMPVEDHFRGFKPGHGSWTEDFDRFKSRHPQGVRIEVEQAGINQLQELIRLCKGNGVPLLLVYSPEYIEMQRLTSNRTQVFEWFYALRDRFDVDLWDYSGSSISAGRYNFYNSQHLNAEGARAFSENLAATLGGGGIGGLRGVGISNP